MHALQTELAGTQNTQIAFIERKSPYNSPFHYHPELELVYIKEGNGKRIIGDKSDSFNAGDVVFVGSNLPHEWKNVGEPTKNSPNLPSHSIVAYFNKEVFSKDFYNLRESYKINSLLNKAGRGIKVNGETRQIVGRKMEELLEKKDFERIIGLMEILHLLSISNELECLVYEGYHGTLIDKIPDRLTEVFNYVTTNYHEDITLVSVAKIAHLTPPAFCRMFKQKTKRNFFSYLNEVRISNACKFLMETGYNISEVAFNCGYRTLSNFNKFFKKSTGLSPKAYREKALA
ncbi:MAG: AraC family transcriptional regulator [Ferruginibacter sp.]